MVRKRYAGVVVKSGDTVLLCKRSPEKKSFPNMWAIPAGKIEKGENTQDAARREFFEETSIDIDDKAISFVGILPVYSKENEIKSMMYVYLLESDERLEPDLDLAVDGHEHTEWGYFSLKTIETIQMGKYMSNLLKIILNKN